MIEEELFNKAVALHGEDRIAFLDQACAGDAALRAAVEALLRADEVASGYLEPRGLGLEQTEQTTSSSEQVGKVVAGRYKLLEQIGEGGMGTVWVAEQREPVKRQVALKLVKPGMDSKSVLARFEAERQALALMDHQNIAKVLDGGVTEQGRPFFVMELVKGMPLTEYCDARRMSVRDRLALFVPICSAVQHAHQKGIIHRDLKPTNILVTEHDGTPVPKVIDFGLAKALGAATTLTDRTLHTAFGTLVGTPLYMAPEQVAVNALDVDTRSDVYSLGVVLYELLTGTTPLEKQRFKEAAWDEIRRVIREEEPPRPSIRLSDSHDALPSISAQRHTEPVALTRLVRGELDWIVMKALEKDCNRRYETANGFAMDVQRYLADEPVLACPPSAWYRIRKFVRRNKGPVLTASLVVVALVVGVIGTAAGLVRAEQQRRVALDNEQKVAAAAAAEKEARRSAEARQAETEAVLTFLENKVIAAARPEGRSPPGGLGRNVTLRRALEAALPEVSASFPAQPLIEARLRLRLATSFATLGDAKVAVEQAERARTIYLQHVGSDHPDTLSSMHVLATCYEAIGRLDDALKLREKTLALMKVKLGPVDPKTLSAMNNLALSYASLGQHAKALRLQEETLGLRRTGFGPDHYDTIGSMNNLALTYTALGRHSDALTLGRETVAIAKAKLGPMERRTLVSIDSLALVYHNAGRPDEAVKLYEETLPLMNEKLGPHQVTLWCMDGLANSYAALGRHREERKVREDALSLWKAKFGADHPNTLSSMSLLAALLAVCPEAKLRDAKRAVELAEQAVQRGPQSAWSWQVLGWARYRAGAWKDSIAALERAIDLRKDGGDSFQWFFLAMAHWELEDKGKAREWYGRAAEWMDKNQPKNEDVRRFRAEAAELLGLSAKK
jgi:eukaryotic-like serine/threonine-protein kinase